MFVEQAGVHFNKQQQQGQQQQQQQQQRKQHRGVGVGGGRGKEGLEHLSFICALLTKEWSPEVLEFFLFSLLSFFSSFQLDCIFTFPNLPFIIHLAISLSFGWPLFFFASPILHFLFPLLQHLQKISAQKT